MFTIVSKRKLRDIVSKLEGVVSNIEDLREYTSNLEVEKRMDRSFIKSKMSECSVLKAKNKFLKNSLEIQEQRLMSQTSVIEQLSQENTRLKALLNDNKTEGNV